jgi:MazG family protein
MSEDAKRAAAEGLIRLMELAARLRGPGGCPWDQAQTAASVAQYLVEEGFEALEAIEADDDKAACAELGDLLFQVVFTAQLYAESRRFDLAQVIDNVHQKLISRHPHVFGDKKAADPDEVRKLWGQIKNQEQNRTSQGLLDSVPAAAPALLRAQRLGQRAALVNFDWKNGREVWQKVQEEMEELAQAPNKAAAQAELGDLLFACAQWARHQDLSAEAALRQANQRFKRRFRQMESLAKARGLNLAELTAEQWDALWEEAKSAEIGPQAAG